jgi:hypothetical protein
MVSHPATRLGFLDALAEKPLDHDRIADRIYWETPPGARHRLGWPDYPPPEAIIVARYRYEEGRLLVKQEGLRCKAWGHPDFPPAQVMKYVRQRFGQGAPT